MFVAGDGGNTQTYRENLEEIGLFQTLDPSNIFSDDQTSESSMQFMMAKVEGAISQFGENDDSMFHAFIEGESRIVDGQIELLLKDGTWYPMQSKMQEMCDNENGIKWFAFNCPRRNEPRFAGVKKRTTTGQEGAAARVEAYNSYASEIEYAREESNDMISAAMERARTLREAARE